MVLWFCIYKFYSRGRIRKQSPRSCDPCCVAEANEANEANEDVTLIITPPISRSDILLTSDTLEQSSHIV